MQLEEYSSKFEAEPEQTSDWYAEVFAAATHAGVVGDISALSPELALRLIEKVDLTELNPWEWEGWNLLCKWLPTAPQPGGSWRIRAARAAARRDPNFGADFHVVDSGSRLGRRQLPFTSVQWQGTSPHLNEFTPEEKKEFLALAPEAVRAHSRACWREDAETAEREGASELWKKGIARLLEASEP